MPGGWEWLIILAIAILLFGGSRLAGLGKGVGRSIREFKEEVKTDEVEGKKDDEVVDAEIVQQQPAPRQDPAQLDNRSLDLEARERELAAREEELRRQREAETGI